MGTLELTEGWSTPIDLQLQADGAAYSLTNLSVALILRTAEGLESIATTSGTQFEQVSSTCGIVRYTPSSGDLSVENQPYSVKVRVTNALGQRAYFPSGRGDDWMVYSQ